MDKLPALKPLKLKGNLAENWRRWKQRYELFMTATEASKKSAKIQSSMLLHLIGEDALEVFNTFEFGLEEDKEKPVEILKKFDKNLTVERHIFNSRMQHPGESIDKCITDLRLKVKTCEYGTMADEMIKDRIVVGVHSDIVRGRLLREKDLCLTKAIDICKAAEASTKQLEKLTDEKKVEILQESRPRTYQAGTKNNRKKTTGPACQNCGRNHPPRRCPAYGKTCNACNKLNHLPSAVDPSLQLRRKSTWWMKLKHRTILILIVPVKICLLALLTPRHHLTNGWKQLKLTLTKSNVKLTLEPSAMSFLYLHIKN